MAQNISCRPKIVLLPGMDGTCEFFAPLKMHLENHLEVHEIAYPRDVELSYAQLTQHVMGRMPSGPLTLLGESFSGPIAIRVASQLSGVVSNLILVSTFARCPMPAAFIQIGKHIPLRWLPRKVINFFLMGSFATKQLSDELHSVLKTVAPYVIQGRIAELHQARCTQQLSEISCPVLCLRGSADYTARQSESKYIVKHKINAQLREIEAPHMLLQTHSAESARIILDFIGVQSEL